MRALKDGGLRNLERLLHSSAKAVAVPLEITARPPRARTWTAEMPDANATLRISVTTDRLMQSVGVSWHELPKPLTLTVRQQKKAQVQEAFYARYIAAGQRAYATPPQRIGRDDRRILLVGEFEADVNNGGFSQYLDNKGRTRATQTAHILNEIGALRTAALLDAALGAEGNDARLQELDDQFYRSKEDLAVLSMQALAGRHE